MTKMYALVTLCCLGLCACRVPETADIADTARTLPSDEDIMAKVYDVAYQVPNNFYVDLRADTPRSYSFYHVKDSSNSFELCTNDYDEALAWEASDNQIRAVNGTYVGSIENDRYFEFVRELSNPESIGNVTALTSPGFARVFKCSYVDRENVDRNLRDGYAGKLHAPLLTEQTMRTFAEYLWQFTFFWPAQKTVLETFSSEQQIFVRHTLVLAFLTNRGTDQCDLIEVIDWVFSVDKNSRRIEKEFKPVYQFDATLVDGMGQKCTD